MNIAALHNLIRNAQQHEAETGRLVRFIRAHLDQVHHLIILPERNPDSVLMNFLSSYINQVPLLLQGAQEVAEGAGISAWVNPVLNIAEQFFLQPPTLVDGREGLEELVSEAYLALRLVEEVNDRYITHLGKPLIPLDLTVANLIVHQLIGEPFANQLDKAVERALSAMLAENPFDQESVQHYREHLYSSNVENAWLNWPCFSRQLGVELALLNTLSKTKAPVQPIKASRADNALVALPLVTGLRQSGGTHLSRHRKP